ncbi:endosomal/lysosomal proton channel TMEM175 isoform X1 [Hydra vulgaris]|uniref:endosomal/lysosomal proton channel TMEM175 isoform X1 n=1 Tax=Hydra vulgaris TaxID=6087 RepID=UPI0001926328|nr:endosomal/lysosomal potassium channel TMEM175 [Hydra vulgaris]XP_012561476.1 endosomal/lysosomal potassium channel TMEM175 [Hydra vulgaris]
MVFETKNTDENVVKTRSIHKHLEEHYDEHVDSLLPNDYHRGDITSSNRLLAYSDAVMATCATFLVLPIRNLKKQTENQSLSNFIEKISGEFIIFFLGFLIILTIWENMNIRAIVIKRVDDFILTLVTFEMLVTTVLPFTLALQGHYPTEKVSVLATCVTLGVLQILDFGIILYATQSPDLLHVNLKKWDKSDLRELTLIMIFRPVVSLILLVIAGAFCLVHFGISWAFIALLIFMPTVRKFYWFIRRRLVKVEKSEKNLFLEHYSKGNISKERIEIMSDAAIAIIACILILDITVEEFPNPDKVLKSGHSLIYSLKHMTSEFLTFLATFCLVSALWYINHAVLHLVETVNSIMLYLQKIFLSFCCLTPLAGNMVLHFGIHSDSDSSIAIRFASMIVFISSTANLFIYLYGNLTGSKYFYEWASFEHYWKNKRQHIYYLAKALNIPFWSLICTLGTLGSHSASPYVLYITFLASPCSFFASKLILMNHVGKTGRNLRKTILRRKSLIKEKPVPANNENELISPIDMITTSLETRYPESYTMKNENFN